MKLCPECEFIYEDDQQCCDMDGTELVYDPKLDLLYGDPVEARSRFVRITAPLRRFAPVLPFMVATLVFCAALAIFYVGYIRRDSHSIIPPASASNPITSESPLSNSPRPLPQVDSIAIPSPETEAGIANSKSASARPGPKTLRNANNPALPSKGRNVAATKAPPPLSVRSLPRVKPLPQLKPLPKAEPSRKRDSRVGSFFKKTGRILTKPFKR